MSKSIVLPINVPKFPHPIVSSAPLAISTPPTPLPQLKPFGVDVPKKGPQQLTLLPIKANNDMKLLPSLAFAPKAIFIPAKVKARLDEWSMTEVQFIQLLMLYDKARNEYLDILKRGFLAFFPFVLGQHWKQKMPQSKLTGRKLVTLIDLYVEEKNKGKVVTPEYLTKKPCQFVVTEQVLKQIVLLHAEVTQDLRQRLQGAGGRDQNVVGVVNNSMANVEMCKRWAERHPDMKITTKQLISVHQMLTFDGSLNKASPEIECCLADIWKMMDRSVSTMAVLASAEAKEDREEEEEEGMEDEDVDVDEEIDDEKSMYDDETVTMDQMQEWILDTQNIPSLANKPKIRRPRYAMKNLRLFWTVDRLEALMKCCGSAVGDFYRLRKKTKSQCLRKVSLRDLLHRQWKLRFLNSKVTKTHLLAKCIRQIRVDKHKSGLEDEKNIEVLKKRCEEFTRNEDLIQVINEEDRLAVEEDDDHGGDNVRPAHATVAAGMRNFHRDEDVLSYIAEVQRTGRGNQPITWTPDVMRDLVRARTIARRRKREWEAWAVREHGGVGYAYNNPDVKYYKVDEMFKEEFTKLRPDMGSLSIWTLIAYARKYDTLKRQLIIDNKQDHLPGDTSLSVPAASGSAPTPPAGPPAGVVRSSSTLFFPNSHLPRFDLDELDKLADVSDEVKLLLRVRQLAKIRQEQKSKFTLATLMEEERAKLRPAETEAERPSGGHMQRRLWRFETDPQNLALVKPALMRTVGEDEDLEAKLYSTFPDDEVPLVKPRRHIFPEDPSDVSFNVPCLVDLVASGAKGQKERVRLNYQRDVFTQSRCKIGVPAVEKEAESREDLEDDEEEGEVADRIRIGAADKVDTLEWPTMLPREVAEEGVDDGANAAGGAAASAANKGKFQCGHCSCSFHNINNYHFHLDLHVEERSPLKLCQPVPESRLNSSGLKRRIARMKKRKRNEKKLAQKTAKRAIESSAAADADVEQ